MKYKVELKEERFPNPTVVEVDSLDAWKKGKELIDSGLYISIKMFGKYGTMIFRKDDNIVECLSSDGRLDMVPKYTENISF